MHFELKSLSNKLKTLFIHLPGSTAASTQIWFRAGSALETQENWGIAHFLEHMFFKGTPQRPGAGIAHEVESFGGEINAFTSFDYTCYYINSPNNKLINTIDILLDMVSNPLFSQEDLIPERDVVFEEYRRSLDNPGQYAFSQLQKACFSGNYAHPILGNEKTIKNFSRSQLLSFRKNFYNSSNAFLVVAGDLSNKKQIVSAIQKYKLPQGPKSSIEPFKIKSRSSAEVHRKDVRMAQLNIVWQAPALTDEDSAAEDLAVNCLGHGETSRLYKNLVLKNSLANASASSTMFMNNGGAHFSKISFPYENLKAVLNELDSTLTEIVRDGLSNSEINKIKNQYVASKVYEKESIESFSFSLGHSFAQTGDLETEERFMQRIKGTSPHAVNKAFREILARPLHLSLQIPKNEDLKQAKQELLSFQKKLVSDFKKQAKNKVTTSSDIRSQFDPQVRLISLKPGISLLYRSNALTPTFILHAYIKGGLTDENEKNNGTHHILSSVLTKGYSGIPYETIKEELENQLATLSGFAGKNAYGLTMHGQTDHFNDLIQHFIGAFILPDYNSKFIEHEKKLTLRALENQKEDPIKQCFHQASKMFFNDHPYALNPLGNAKYLKKINKSSLQLIHDKNLNEKEILITYCGDLEIQEVIEALSPLTDVLKPRTAKKTKSKPIAPITGKDAFIPFEREQTQIFIGIPTPPLTSTDNLCLKMLTTHLSGQSSKLFVEVRDRQGLCYTAQPVHFNALEAGYWGIYMASGHDKVDRAVVALEEILNEIKNNGLSKKEFNRLKTMIEGQDKVNIQTNEDYANIYSIAALHQLGIDHYHQNNEFIKKMEYADFQSKIKKILSRPWNKIIVGRK